MCTFILLMSINVLLQKLVDQLAEIGTCFSINCRGTLLETYTSEAAGADSPTHRRRQIWSSFLALLIAQARVEKAYLVSRRSESITFLKSWETHIIDFLGKVA